jgi:L-lysine 6-transaminase
MKLALNPNHIISANDTKSTLGKHILADGFDVIMDLEKSHGSWIVDARNGNKYLDFFTCFASMPIGLNHPKLNNPEFIDYIGKVSLNKPSNSDMYTEVYASFVNTFFSQAVPEQYKYAFFIEGGALANENALKIAFDWKVRKNFAKGYTYELGSKVIHFKQSFHGRSGYTMSLTNTDPNKVLYFPKFKWPRITNPKLTFPLTDEILEKVIWHEKQACHEIEQAFLEHKDDIAAIIIEPIQAEGGDNHFRLEFMKKLRQYADEHDCLLIFDEVQTGVGLTGTFWASEQMGIMPDIITFGKKMQVCGLICTDRIDDIAENVFHKASRINSTWGGNLTDMARAAKYIEVIYEENLLENVKIQGTKLLSELHSLENEFSGMITNSRARGLFAAFDIQTDKRSAFINKVLENGLMILGCGENTVRFRPALNISASEIDLGMDIIRKSLKQI